MSLTDKIVTLWEKEDAFLTQEHIFSNSKMKGASRLSPCLALQSMKDARIKLPVKTGMKAETGAMRVGRWFHDNLEQSARTLFVKDRNSHPGIVFMEECMIATILTEDSDRDIVDKIAASHPEVVQFFETPISVDTPIIDLETTPNWDDILTHDQAITIDPNFDDLVLTHPDWVEEAGYMMIISPIDLAYVTSPGFILRKVKFANVTKWRPFKHPDAKFLSIYDIKSCDESKFQKLANLPIKDVDVNYWTQFNVYIFATHLEKMVMLVINKEKCRMKEVEIKFDPTCIPYTIRKWNRVEYLSNLMEGKKQYEDVIKQDWFDEKDLDCLNSGSWSWWSCECSECSEEDNGGYVRLKLDKLCPFAQRKAIIIVMERYHIGTQWKRGNSFVTIQAIDPHTGIIKSMNKSGTVYEDSAPTALNMFKELR